MSKLPSGMKKRGRCYVTRDRRGLRADGKRIDRWINLGKDRERAEAEFHRIPLPTPLSGGWRSALQLDGTKRTGETPPPECASISPFASGTCRWAASWWSTCMTIAGG